MQNKEANKNSQFTGQEVPMKARTDTCGPMVEERLERLQREKMMARARKKILD